MIRHPFDPDDVALDQLKVELEARLGRPIELLTSESTEAEPSALILEDPATGEHLDVDPVMVAEVLSVHTPAVRLTAEEQALAAFEAATTVVERLAVFRAYLARQVADQREQRVRSREALDQLREHRRIRREIRGGA